MLLDGNPRCGNFPTKAKDGVERWNKEEGIR